MLEENKALRMRLHSLTIFRGLLEDPVAVSYTHLDVYKRQLWNSSPT